MIPAIRTRLIAAQAVDLGAISVGGGAPAGWDTEFTRRARGRSRAELVRLFSDVDIAIMLPGAQPNHRPYAAMQDVLRDGSGRTIHFHWAGAYGMDGIERTVDTLVDRAYLRVLLETDYAALSAVQSAFETAMRGAEVRVTTPEGTDIRFRIGDRPVTRQDGNASSGRAAMARNLIDREIELPAGAIRVAPIETSVHGTIAFPSSIWAGYRIEGLVMTFAEGQLVDMQANTTLDAVQQELDAAGPAGQAFREMAVGFNPLLAIPEADPWIPYYGYGAGIVRLSLGDNSELGGNVTGGYVRWNFFTNATVTVGDTTWVRDRRLVEPSQERPHGPG